MTINFKKISLALIAVVLVVMPFSRLGARWFIFSKRKQKSFKSAQFKHNPTPDNTLIAFDLHDTLFNFDRKGLVKRVAQYSTVGAVATGAAYGLFGLKGLVAAALPAVVVADVVARIVYAKINQGYRPVIEHVWDADPLLRLLKPLYIDLANLFVPNHDMFALIDELKGHGYNVIVASNIGPAAWSDLQKRYSELLKKFDGIVHPHKQNNWTDKKQPKKYFGELAEYANQKGLAQVLFIDNKTKNCGYAQQQDAIVAAHFRDAQQLRQYMSSVGVL